MKQLNAFVLSTVILGACTANADDHLRDNLLSVFKEHSSVELAKDTQNLYGINYDTEKFKFGVSKGSNLIAFYGNIKLDPLQDRKWFVKGGLSYINQDFESVKYDSRAVSLATGYMLQNDLYIEVGGKVNKYDDSTNLMDDTITTIETHGVKRFNSSIGTADIYLGISRSNADKFIDQTYYSGKINYYPVDNALLAFGYSYSDHNIMNSFNAAYGYLYASYNKNITDDTTYSIIGLQCAFSEVTNFSSYKMPTNIKRHISE